MDYDTVEIMQSVRHVEPHPIPTSIPVGTYLFRQVNLNLAISWIFMVLLQRALGSEML